MATRHLAWAPACCGYPAFTNPVDISSNYYGSRVLRVVCEAPPVDGRCTSKSALWGYDNATPVLQAFARTEALRVAHLWNAPPIVVRYLKTGDESIRADAANATISGNAAQDAARYAVAHDDDAGWDTATGAAWNAAWAIAETGTRGDHVKWAAAWDTTRRRQARRLTKLLVAGRRIYSQRQIP